MFLALALPTWVLAQVDTLFWMALPDVYKQNNIATPLKLSSTFQQGGRYEYSFYFTDSKGKVQKSRLGWAYMSDWGIQTGTSTASFTNFLYPEAKGDFSRIAIKFKSPTLATCFLELSKTPNGETKDEPSDTYSMKGFNGLGTHFIAPFQDIWESAVNSQGQTLDIVASEDNTALIITPANNLKAGQQANVPFAIKMTQGQTYRVQAASYLINQRLAGTVIKSNKPIAVTMSDFATRYDNNKVGLNGDQLIPVEVLGSEYILVKGKYEDVDALGNITNLDRYFITAVYDNTEVRVGGNLVVALNAGQSYNRKFAEGVEAEYVLTSNPVYVYQISGMGKTPAGAIVPSINCNGNNSISTFLPSSHLLYENDIENRPNHDFYKTKTGMIIFVKSGAENSFDNSINPNTLPKPFPIYGTDFKSVPGTGNAWKYAFYDLTPYTYTSNNTNEWRDKIFRPYFSNTTPVYYRTKIQNKVSNFHAAVLSGGENNGKFAYFTNFIDLKLPDTANVGCTGDSVYLYAGAGGEMYKWNFKDPITGQLSNLGSGRYVYAKKPGLYIVEKKTETCLSKDSTVVKFEKPIPPKLGNDTAFCVSNFSPFSLSVPNNYLFYRWNDDIDLNQPSLIADKPRKYILETIDKNFCLGYDTLEIKVISPKLIELGNDTVFCGNVPWQISLDPTKSYTWSPSNLFANPNSNSQTIAYGFNHKVFVKADSAQCTYTDSITIQSGTQVLVNEFNKDIIMCDTDSILIGPAPKPNQIYNWIPPFALDKPNLTKTWYKQSYPGLVNQYFNLNISENENPCKLSIDVKITIKPSPVSQVYSSMQVCNGDAIEINLSPSYTYTWENHPLVRNRNSHTQVLYPVSNTTLKFTSDQNECKRTETIDIEVLPRPKFEFVAKDTICEGEELEFRFSGADSYSINNSSTFYTNQVTVQPISSETYLLKAINFNGCDSSVQHKLTVKPKPRLKFKLQTLKYCLQDGEPDIKDLVDINSVEDYNIYWQNTKRSTSIVDNYGIYYIQNETQECIAKDSILISNSCPSGVFVPRSFSPNNDGDNDVLVIFKNQIVFLDISIFNKWGEIIYQSANLYQSWDGTYLDKPAEAGVYAYVLKYIDSEGKQENQSGSVVLIR